MPLLTLSETNLARAAARGELLLLHSVLHDAERTVGRGGRVLVRARSGADRLLTTAGEVAEFKAQVLTPLRED